MAEAITTTTIPRPVTRVNIGPTRLVTARIVQNFLLIWLDANIDEVNNIDSRNTITKLRQVVNATYPFVDVRECIEFIRGIKTEKAFMIVSGRLGEQVVSTVHDMPQLVAMYVLCENKTRHEKWANQWLKICGVFTDITPICEALRSAVRDCDQNSVSISLVRATDRVSQDELDPSFMYTQILREILLTIDFEPKHINEFLDYCREQFAGNTAELDNVDKFQNEYAHHSPIWWYTYPCFLYSMLNRALRLTNVDLIIKMGFFLRDLYQNIVQLHAQQSEEHDHLGSFIVYRGQNLSHMEFDLLQKTHGGLLSFNNFLSTSRNRAVSLAFVQRTVTTSNLVGVLFIMKIDPSIPATCFANVKKYSFYQGEEEILISMQSVFRIGQMKQIDGNERLWEVEVTLTSDKDPRLQQLTDYIKEETFSSPAGWPRLGQLLLKMGESNKAEQVYQTLLEQINDSTEEAHIYNQLGKIKYNQGEYQEAIDFYSKSSEIRRQSLPSDHPSLATSHNNIGAVYHNMGDYPKALSSYEKALAILQKSLPSTHPHLASSYNNIAVVYDNMGDYPKALSAYEKALAIRQQSLPPNHPDLAASYDNIGGVYDSMGEYSKALLCLEKALAIKQQSLPPAHPSLASTYSNIGLLYHKLSEYSKAISSMEKAIQIYEQSLPANHPNLAISYNNIALVHDNIGEYSKALSYHEKALNIRQKSLPAQHPDLAISHNNIGLVYDKSDKCSEALDHYKRALEIYRQTLPTNHPNLGATLNNMGEAYDKMRDYSKAHSSYQQALTILGASLPANHPHIQLLEENINRIKKKL